MLFNKPVFTIVGGLFECYEDLEDPSLWQDNSEDPESQEQGRIDMLQLANHIVPGHGKMFQVPENYKKHLRVVMYTEEHYEQTIGNKTTSSHQSEYVVFEKDDWYGVRPVWKGRRGFICIDSTTLKIFLLV